MAFQPIFVPLISAHTKKSAADLENLLRHHPKSEIFLYALKPYGSNILTFNADESTVENFFKLTDSLEFDIKK